VQNDLLPGSRAAALREVLRSLECDTATKAFLDGFVPSTPDIKPVVPVGAPGSSHLLGALAAAGAAFSIDSLAELDSAVALGIDPRAVLYRNGGKDVTAVREAALRGVWRFAVDCERALSAIASGAPGAAAYVYIAVCSEASARCSGVTAQEALRLLRMAPELGLRPYGLAFNVGPERADAATYARAIDRCGLVMRRLGQLGTRLEMLGLGGALGGDAADPAVLAALERLPYRPSLLAAEP
jgi:diaminopimelate decarboxylase